MKPFSIFFNTWLSTAIISVLAHRAGAASVSTWHSGPGRATETNLTTCRFQGSRCRIDFAADFTTLLNGDSGFGYQILHPAKIYVRQKLTQMQSSTCGGVSNAAPPVATGGSQVLAGYHAFEYRSTNTCGVRIFWVAPDYPDWQNFREQSAPAMARLAGRTELNPGGAPLPGMVVQVETLVSGRAGGVATVLTNQSTLISASIVPDDPGLMQIPDGYREVKSFEEAAIASTNKMTAQLLQRIGAVPPPRSRMTNSLAQQFEGQQAWRSNAVPAFLGTSGPTTVSPARSTKSSPDQSAPIELAGMSWNAGGSAQHVTRAPMTNTWTSYSPLPRLRLSTNSLSQSNRIGIRTEA